MAEITPLTPTNPIIRPRRVESDDKRHEEEHPPKQEKGEDEPPDNGAPVQHIDERV